VRSASTTTTADSGAAAARAAARSCARSASTPPSTAGASSTGPRAAPPGRPASKRVRRGTARGCAHRGQTQFRHAALCGRAVLVPEPRCNCAQGFCSPSPGLTAVRRAAGRGMCVLLKDAPDGSPPNVVQAGPNTLFVAGTPGSERVGGRPTPQAWLRVCRRAHDACGCAGLGLAGRPGQGALLRPGSWYSCAAPQPVACHHAPPAVAGAAAPGCAEAGEARRWAPRPWRHQRRLCAAAQRTRRLCPVPRTREPARLGRLPSAAARARAPPCALPCPALTCPALRVPPRHAPGWASAPGQCGRRSWPDRGCAGAALAGA